MKDKKFNTGLIVFIVLILLAIGYSIFAALKSDSWNISSVRFEKEFTYSTSPSEKPSKEFKKDYIAKIYLEGTIDVSNYNYNQNWIMSVINKLTYDSNNAGIILVINSPGGAVYQADEVYLALEQYKQQGKKIYVYMGPLAASGGYYIACAGNKIYANRNTLTGSIGVISGEIFDLTELFEKTGIYSETIHAGKNKNMGNYNEPFSDEQREILQSVADECYEQFVGVVANGRFMTRQEVRKLADGRIYTAKQALDNGLIDAIDSYDNMQSDFVNEIGKPGIKVKVFRYEREKTVLDMVTGAVSKISNSQAAAKTGLPVNVFEDLNDFHSYPAYLYK